MHQLFQIIYSCILYQLLVLHTYVAASSLDAPDDEQKYR
jgi:hypothetical protein